MLFKFWIGIFAIFVGVGLTWQNANAAPLQNIPVSLVQPDGTKFNCFATGDEFYNWLHDKDGYTIIQNEKTGYYEYAKLSGDKFISTGVRAESGATKFLSIKPWEKLPTKVLEKRKTDFLNLQKTYKDKSNFSNKTLTGTTGNFNNIVIYIRFSDEVEFTDLQSTYTNMFNASGVSSLKTYFNEVSYNQLSVNTSFYPTNTGSTVVSYQDQHPRAYYQPYNAATNPTGYQGGDDGSERTNREHVLLKNAVAAVASQVPADLNIDNDNDGKVDNVCFIVSGSPNGWSSLLWPHMWSLYSQYAYINSKRVYTFNFQIQSSTMSSGVGVLCHEMFHTLGAPDLYHYSYDGLHPVWKWDLMEYNQNPPQHMTMYMKWKYGHWLSTLPTITTPGTYKLAPTAIGKNCYKIPSPNSSSEYFVIEYRKKMGLFDQSLPANGLIIYRINPSYEGNADGPPDELYIYRPNGTSSAEGNPASAYFSANAGRVIFCDTTNPKDFLSNGTLGGISVYDISSLGDTMSFKIGFDVIDADAPTLVSPEDLSTGAAIPTQFTWSTTTATSSYPAQVQISTNPDFSSFILDTTISSVKQFKISYLKYNTKYYWRARLKTGTTTYTDWSLVSTFTTAAKFEILYHTGNLCWGNTIGLYFTSSGTFNTANFFQVQLSDRSGRFSTFSIIGIKSSQSGGTIYGELPDSINTSSNYKVRIVSSDPFSISPEYAFNETVWGKLRPLINGNVSHVCKNTVEEYNTTIDPRIFSEWSVKNGKIIGANDSNYVKVLWDSTGNAEIKILQGTTSGCLDSTTVKIKVNVVPTPSIVSGDNSVCRNADIIYAANNGEDVVSNKWIADGGTVETLINKTMAKIHWDSVGTQKLTLIQTNNAGCAVATTMEINVSESLSLNIRSIDTICANETALYKTNRVDGVDMLWTATGGKIIGSNNQDSVLVYWTDNKNANLKLTKTSTLSKCVVDTTINVVVNKLPAPNVNGSLLGCVGKELVLFMSENENMLHTWQIDNADLKLSAKSDTATIIINTPGTHQLYVSNVYPSGCSSFDTLHISIADIPEMPILTISNDTVLTCSFKGKNEWYFNGELITTNNSGSLPLTATGKYQVRSVGVNGCKSEMSEPFEFTSGILSAENVGIRIFPNPADRQIQIDATNFNHNLLSIEITDINGKSIISKQLGSSLNQTQSIDVSTIPTGTYMIIINSEKGRIIERISIIR